MEQIHLNIIQFANKIKYIWSFWMNNKIKYWIMDATIWILIELNHKIQKFHSIPNSCESVNIPINGFNLHQQLFILLMNLLRYAWFQIDTKHGYCVCFGLPCLVCFAVLCCLQRISLHEKSMCFGCLHFFENILLLHLLFVLYHFVFAIF